jgi:hypothetical protein
VGVRLAQQRDEQAPSYNPAERSAGRQTHAHAERAAADNSGARTGSSAHDEPLQTADSNPAAKSKTGGQSERIEKGE